MHAWLLTYAKPYIVDSGRFCCPKKWKISKKVFVFCRNSATIFLFGKMRPFFAKDQIV